MAKMIENMNGKKMTHKLLKVDGVVTGTGVFSRGLEMCLRYVSGDEMKETWFPAKELALTVVAAKKAPVKKAVAGSSAPAKKRGRPSTKKVAPKESI